MAGLTVVTLVSLSSRNRIRGTRALNTALFNIHLYWLMSLTSSPKCRMAMHRMPPLLWNLCTEKPHLRIILGLLFFFPKLIFFEDFIYLLLEWKGERKRGKETSMCGCLSRAPYWGPGPLPRHVPWLGIEPVTLCFAGGHSIHWATPARARASFFKQWYIYIFIYIYTCIHIT